MRSLISRSSTPVFTISGASDSNSSSPGTRVPSGRSAVRRSASSCDRSCCGCRRHRPGGSSAPRTDAGPAAAGSRRWRRACPAAVARPLRRVWPARRAPRRSTRLLLEEHLARDGLHVGIGQRHADREPIRELLEPAHLGQGALTGADHDDVALELLGDRFGYLGDQRGAVVRVADVLLDLVQDQDGAGQTPGASRESHRAEARGARYSRQARRLLSRAVRPEQLPLSRTASLKRSPTTSRSPCRMEKRWGTLSGLAFSPIAPGLEQRSRRLRHMGQ